MSFVIGSACIDVKDRRCLTECPVDCIYEGRRKLYIHPDECIECGACEPLCPAGAIYFGDDVPPEEAGHVEAARQFFARIGSPRGARAFGPIDADVLPEGTG